MKQPKTELQCLFIYSISSTMEKQRGLRREKLKIGPTPGFAVKTWHISALYTARTRHYYPFLTVFITDEIKTDLIKVWQYIEMLIAPVHHNIVDIDDTLSHFIPV